MTLALVGLGLGAIAVVGITFLCEHGCVSASHAKPVSTTFPFAGHTLNVDANGLPTDLVATDRHDILVTRWFEARFGTGKKTSWSLRHGTLNLDASCTGLALCSTRFRVEVPRNIAVLRNGDPTHLRGTGRP